MKKTLFGKLHNRKGSSLPEALIGFLIVTLTSMILMGTVLTSQNIITIGDELLKIVYAEQRALDIFVHHNYTTKTYFETAAGEDADKVSFNYSTDDTAGKTQIVFTDTGTEFGTYEGTVSAPVAYCRANRSGTLCFTTPPSWVIK